MVHAEVSRVRRGEERKSGTPGPEELENCGTGKLIGGKRVARRGQGVKKGRGDLRESRDRGS